LAGAFRGAFRRFVAPPLAFDRFDDELFLDPRRVLATAPLLQKMKGLSLP
jgi:hypothetical protein